MIECDSSLLTFLARRPLTVAALSALPSWASDTRRSIAHTTITRDALQLLIEHDLIMVETVAMGSRDLPLSSSKRRHRRYLCRSKRGDAIIEGLKIALQQKNLAQPPERFRNATAEVWQQWKAWRGDVRFRRADYRAAIETLPDFIPK